MKAGLDSYTLKARVMPVLLVFFPVGLAVAAWSVGELPGWGTLIGLFVPFGLTPFLAQAGRDLGKRKEKALFQIWGGKPSTKLLRYSDSTLNPFTKDRYHLRLHSLVPKLLILRPEDERADPNRADNVYESYTNYLIERTRIGDENRLVAAENINYGYRRNLWAMKPAGATLAVIGFVTCALKVFFGDLQSSAVPLAATTVNAALAVWWIMRITPGWVYIAGEAYARRLLERSETLGAAQDTQGIVIV